MTPLHVARALLHAHEMLSRPLTGHDVRIAHNVAMGVLKEAFEQYDGYLPITICDAVRLANVEPSDAREAIEQAVAEVIQRYGDHHKLAGKFGDVLRKG